ncbi:MAG: hypothetical protein ACYC18_00090 [Gammaproteobacteria bacterium]|nr:hypothetical protein [Gammaproteobacteria bacterium]
MNGLFLQGPVEALSDAVANLQPLTPQEARWRAQALGCKAAKRLPIFTAWMPMRQASK